MTQEPTLPSSEEGYRTVTLQIGEKTFKRLLQALEVSGSYSPEHFVYASVMEHIKQIELAHQGTILHQTNTLTGENGIYFSAELHNAYECGRQQREKEEMNNPPARPALVSINGGKL